jgi:hypothetical protein
MLKLNSGTFRERLTFGGISIPILVEFQVEKILLNQKKRIFQDLNQDKELKSNPSAEYISIYLEKITGITGKKPWSSLISFYDQDEILKEEDEEICIYNIENR